MDVRKLYRHCGQKAIQTLKKRRDTTGKTRAKRFSFLRSLLSIVRGFLEKKLKSSENIKLEGEERCEAWIILIILCLCNDKNKKMGAHFYHDKNVQMG